MRWLHINRRTHLYLGLALLPWLFMYGVSSLAFTHGPYFEKRDKAGGEPLWTTAWERPFDVAVPAEGDLRPVGARIMREAGLDWGFGAYKPNPNRKEADRRGPALPLGSFPHRHACTGRL
jgi:hypothetical protein